MKKMDFVIVNINKSQEKVSEGMELEINKIDGKEKDKLEFKEVLFSSKKGKVSIGKPFVKGVKVTAQLLEQKKGKKITTNKFKAKSRYRRRIGNRARLTKIKIVKI